MEIKRWIKKGMNNGMPYQYVDAIFFTGNDGNLYLQFRRCTVTVRILYCIDYKKKLHIDYGVHGSHIPDVYRNFVKRYLEKNKAFILTMNR